MILITGSSPPTGKMNGSKVLLLSFFSFSPSPSLPLSPLCFPPFLSLSPSLGSCSDTFLVDHFNDTSYGATHLSLHVFPLSSFPPLLILLSHHLSFFLFSSFLSRVCGLTTTAPRGDLTTLLIVLVCGRNKRKG